MVQRAVAVLVALLLGVFGMDVASLVRIQLIQADEHRSKAESQQLSDTEIQPQRGLIYDRNKKVLAQSANVWLVYINPSKIPYPFRGSQPAPRKSLHAPCHSEF